METWNGEKTMAKKTTTKKTGKRGKASAKKTRPTNAELCSEFAAQVIARMEQGDLPSWTRPIVGGLPLRMGTLDSKGQAKPYRGWNVFQLLFAMGDHGWTSPYFGTFKACTDARAKYLKAQGHTLEKRTGRNGREYLWDTTDDSPVHGVKKGEKGTPVILWKWIDVEKKDSQGNVVLNADGKPKMTRIPLIRTYVVFNADQCQNLGLPTVEQEDVNQVAKIEEAIQEYLNQNQGLKITEQFGACGSYSPKLDTITLSTLAEFIGTGEFYGTKLHEIIHSTGHESRLDRDLSCLFGSHPYAREELVADMGAAILCGLFGIQTEKQIENHAAYLAGWMKALKDDPEALVWAGQAAQKAVDFFMGTTWEDTEAA